MKLRLRENSLRLRLLQTEVRRLREFGYVTEKIIFGANPAENLIYSLRVSENLKEISATMTSNTIEISLPLERATKWAESNEVGLYGEQKISDTVTLKIVVEKDFVCTDRPGDADNADAFPHPRTNC